MCLMPQCSQTRRYLTTTTAMVSLAIPAQRWPFDLNWGKSSTKRGPDVTLPEAGSTVKRSRPSTHQLPEQTIAAVESADLELVLNTGGR